MYSTVSTKIEQFHKLFVGLPPHLCNQLTLSKKKNYQYLFSHHMVYNSLKMRTFLKYGLPSRRCVFFKSFSFQQNGYCTLSNHRLHDELPRICVQQTRYCSGDSKTDDYNSESYQELPGEEKIETCDIDDTESKPSIDHADTEGKKNKTTATSKNRRHAVKASGLSMKNDLSNGDMRPVAANEIKEYLHKNDIAFTDGYTCYITTCPRYVRRKMNMKQVNKMFINMTTGYFVCLSCKRNGSWSNFVDNADSLLSTDKGRLPECFSNITLHDIVKSSSRGKQIWDSCITVQEVEKDALQMTQQLLGIDNLNSAVLEKYQVRFFNDKAGIVLPYFGLDGSLSGVRTIAEEMTVSHGQERMKVISRTYPVIDFHGLFGVNTIDKKQQEVVLVITELDAMAVRQETGVPALALPKKDSILPQKGTQLTLEMTNDNFHCAHNLELITCYVTKKYHRNMNEVLPMLEQFKKITLWFGGDMKVWESAKHFSKKLNPNRCHLVRPDETHPSPLDALNRGLKLKSILRDAQPVQHKSITSFRHLRDDVFNELIQAEQVSGVKWKRYPQLNKLLKGHRRGELTVITGPTGCGKTTFISDYSLDLCMQGVNTLWGSFEINNIRLMKTMLLQFSETNLTKHLDQFDYWADQFQQLPMYMMTFHGQENIYNVIETMSHAVYVHDIAHVIVDNLQFMMGSDYSGSGINAVSERFMKQDQIVGAFRKFATNKNCHVTLVIHPRKERDTDELTISSIFGGAKASQEADNVLIIQDRRAHTMRGRKYVQVAKNRFDGDLGIMVLKFDKETLRYNVKSSERKEDNKKSGAKEQMYQPEKNEYDTNRNSTEEPDELERPV